MANFVKPDSIVRRIWGDADVILLIFAGSAAEFAVNKAVDWLFFTGRLPADPIGRLFSTVQYAQQIVFASQEQAEAAIGRMRTIHAGVEASRGYAIPDWAYRDVLYMLIDYSERAFTLLHRPLTDAERSELFDVFRRVGAGMGVPGLPATYPDWQIDRAAHLAQDVAHTTFSEQLYERYYVALGGWRFALLKQAQALLVPAAVAHLLPLPRRPWLRYVAWTHQLANVLRLRALMQWVLMPAEYLAQVRALDVASAPKLARP